MNEPPNVVLLGFVLAEPKRCQVTGLDTLKSLQRKQKHEEALDGSWVWCAVGLNGLLLLDCLNFQDLESNEVRWLALRQTAGGLTSTWGPSSSLILF